MMMNDECSWTTQSVWADNSAELANCCAQMLNRVDCCGGYRTKPTTRKETDRDWVPMREALVGHFAGERVIGLHSTTEYNTVQWLAFDIDAHNADDDAGKNHDKAMTVAARLEARGYTPYIFDSDGSGGYHVWAILHRQTPAQEAFWLARAIAEDLDIEAYPKQPEIREGGYGSWIRLPGKHHTRNHWSRIWTDAGWGTAETTIAAIFQMTKELQPCQSVLQNS